MRHNEPINCTYYIVPCFYTLRLEDNKTKKGWVPEYQTLSAGSPVPSRSGIVPLQNSTPPLIMYSHWYKYSRHHTSCHPHITCYLWNHNTHNSIPVKPPHALHANFKLGYALPQEQYQFRLASSLWRCSPRPRALCPFGSAVRGTPRKGICKRKLGGAMN